MFKKFTAPYRWAPAIVSIARIDAALAAGAQAEIQSPGRGGYKSTSLVTLRTLDGRVVDSWPLQGNIQSAHKFVAAYNRKLASMPRPAAPPQPPPGYPQQGQPQQTTGWTTQMPRAAGKRPGPRDLPPQQPWLGRLDDDGLLPGGRWARPVALWLSHPCKGRHTGTWCQETELCPLQWLCS